MIQKLTIKNYKSIVNDEISLGRVNVFIGANGVGKTNILEAIAMVAASKSHELTIEGLYNRGVRVTKPSLTFNSFLGKKQKDKIEIGLELDKDDVVIDSIFSSENPNNIYAEWTDERRSRVLESKEWIKNEIAGNLGRIDIKSIFAKLAEKTIEQAELKKLELPIGEYLIYTLNTQSLRGITKTSLKQPLGINGEGLDTLLANFNKEELTELKEYNYLIEWLKEIVVDEKDLLKHKGHKLGRSTSELYFKDEFMRKNNNIFSAENANEGALYILFYLALFISKNTPKFFAIDNIETALNPKLCRTLMKTITQLATKNGKQVLITTHNPAVLDGLNLNDDNQRLFVVSRTDEGHTQTKRIKVKPNSEKKYKLSELWMRGMLGGLPNNFF